MKARGLASVLCVAIVSLGASNADPERHHERSAVPNFAASIPDHLDALSLPDPLPFYYDLFTFRGDQAGNTKVVAAIAVPVDKLRRERRDRRFRYRFDVMFVLADTAQRSVVNTEDSVYVSTATPLAGEHLLHTYVEVQAPPSEATLQRVVVTDASRPGVGQLYNSPFAIPDYSGDELMVSDIAFGLPGVNEGWTRRGVTLALLPTSQFPESSFDVYYEIYNLPSGNPYETEITIEPLDDSGAGERGVRTRFSGESKAEADGSLAELRRVESALPKGRYRLTVTVRDDVSGNTATRSRMVEVRGWGRGTTMVQARPYGTSGLER